jgi:hypothetical protein
VRLTLRTLLAYLDDTLEPAQAKLIGQKVAESDTARELIARIKQVTRKRRLTSPPATGPGSKLDPNVAAEYLDNSLDNDQLAEVEQIALGSDVHLAEVAACHQILTLVLGEPVLIPPSSRQRMYGLVKGREAVPFRKPEKTAEAEPESSPDLETDETLRLGLPAYRARGSWSSQLAVIGGGIAAALILALAIWQALRPRGGDGQDQRVQATDTKGDRVTPTAKGGPASEETKQTGEKKQNPSESKDTGTGKKKPEDTGTGNGGGTQTKPSPIKDFSPFPDDLGQAHVPVEAPDPKVRQVAQFVDEPAEEPTALLQRVSDKGPWRLLGGKVARVDSGQPLVALPGFQGTVQFDNGLRLTLWGLLPELRVVAHPLDQVVESRVVLHAPPSALDLDLTLERGRIYVSNPTNKSLRARVRFDNPTNPDLLEAWDLTLEGPGTEFLVEHDSIYPTSEPFYKNPKASGRKGPIARVHLLVLEGAVSLHYNEKTVRLTPAPSQEAVVRWESHKGVLQQFPIPVKDVPWAGKTEQLPKELEEKKEFKPYLTLRKETLAARDDLAKDLRRLGADKLELALDAAYKSAKPADNRLAVRCYGAVDDLDSLIDALSEEGQIETKKGAKVESPDRPWVRDTANLVLRSWIASGRDNDDKLYKRLQEKGYNSTDAGNVLQLLHYFSSDEAARPETYNTLIDYLDSRKTAIRELAIWHLRFLAPVVGHDGKKTGIPEIPYLASMPPDARHLVQQRYTRLVADGKIPPKGTAPGE